MAAFLNDTFTDTNSTDITSHTGETGATWIHLYPGDATNPTIVSNRLASRNGTTGMHWYRASGAAPSVDQYVEAVIRYAQDGGTIAYGDISQGVIARCSGTDISNMNMDAYGYAFGWNDADKRWQLEKILASNYSSAPITQTNTVYDVTRTVGESRTIKIVVTGTTTTNIKCYVNNYLVIEYNDSTDPITTAGYGGLWEIGYAYSFEFDSITGGDLSAPDTSFQGNAFQSSAFQQFGGVLAVGDINQALTGQSLTVTGDKLGVGHGLTGQSVAVSRGTLGVGPQLTGQQVSISQGTLGVQVGSDVSQALAGQSATVSRGTLAASTDQTVALTGQSVTVSRGTLGVVVTQSVALTGQSATVSQGTLSPSLSIMVGATGAQSLAPAATTTYFSTGGTKVFIKSHNSGVWKGDYYLFQTELGSFGGAGSGRYRAAPQQAQISTEGFPTLSDAAYQKQNPYFNGAGQTQTFGRGSDAAPNQYYDDSSPYSYGGYISVDEEDNVHLMYTRIRAFHSGSLNGNYADAQIHFAYQHSDITTNAYIGPEVTKTHQDTLNTNLNAYNTGGLGVYGIYTDKALIFYTQEYNTAGEKALTGKAVTVSGGLLTPVGSNGVELTGRAATISGGTLTPSINGVTADATVQLTGRSMTVSRGTIIASDFKQNYVPAVVTRTNRGTTLGGLHSAEQIIASFTGADEVYAIEDFFTVVKSGYGDLIYVTYLSGTKKAPSVPAYVGLVVMDALTLSVTSHILTSLGTQLTPVLGTSNYAANRTGYWVSVPTAQTVKLSNGTSVTQYVLGRHVVHLSWTSGTKTSPTLTVKAGPSVTGGRYLVESLQSLEQKGDEVYHVLVEASSSSATGFYLEYNDATTSGASWTVTGSTVWTTASGFSSASFESGFAKGKKTLFYGAQQAADPTSDTPARSFTAWTNFWAGQQPYLTVEAEGRVGRVTVTIVNAIEQQLTGQSLTVSQGKLGLVQPLTGQSATVSYGTLTPTVGGAAIDQPLTGQSVTAAYGALTPTISVALTGQAVTVSKSNVGVGHGLTGQAVTVSKGNVGVGHGLTGQQATVQQGTLTPTIGYNVTLTGQSVTVARGSLAASSGVTLAGQQATVQRGSFGVGLAVVPTGQVATVSYGTLTPGISKALTGQQVAVSRGSFQVFMDLVLSGLQITISHGDVSNAISTTVNVTGVYATGEVGTVTAGDTLIPESAYLWVVHLDDLLFVVEKPVEQARVEEPVDIYATLTTSELFQKTDDDELYADATLVD
jgi:hypothetical protein